MEFGNRCESICFSPRYADALNEKAYELDSRLFLFAHYEPKPYIEKESWHSKFKTAVVNLYGLLWDCSPFLHNLMRTTNSVVWNNWKQRTTEFNELKQIVSSFRSVYCHNCSDKLYLNAENFLSIENWISKYFYEEMLLSDFEEHHWERLLNELEILAANLINTLDDCLTTIGKSTDTIHKNNTIDWWLYSIAEAYCQKPEYLLHTMAALYQLYLDNGGNYFNIDLYASHRAQTIRWLTYYCGARNPRVWYDKWIDKAIKYDERQDCSAYQLIVNWPEKWAEWSGRSKYECEPPFPGGDFFRVLASDVDEFACNPVKGYIVRK